MMENGFLPSISIMVVDSDESTRRHLNETLTELGYRIFEEADLPSAQNRIEKQKIDLVICNVLMPAAEVVEFLLRIKRRRQQTPVILLTSVIDESTRKELTGAGADAFLTKPFRIGRVEEIIATTLLKYDQASLYVPRSRKRILVIDDDPELLEFMLQGLKAIGYDAESRKSGADGVAAFIDQSFDLVIADYMLSDISGVKLLRKLREIRTEVPFVIITGYPLAYPPSSAKADGVDAYLTKPFRINQMEQVITSLLYPEKSRKQL